MGVRVPISKACTREGFKEILYVEAPSAVAGTQRARNILLLESEPELERVEEGLSKKVAPKLGDVNS